MKPIGEIRQLRLQQFVAQTGFTFAEINEKLGRNRRDATLNQVSNAAKNTSTGKPRRMGDTQARMLESVFDFLPSGWFDSDPEERPDIIFRTTAGELKLKALSKDLFVFSGVRESPPNYDGDAVWPFEAISRAAIVGLAPADRSTLERLMLAFIGQPVPSTDWQATALRLAAELDKSSPEPNFTLFVRAVQTELVKLTGTSSKAPAKNENRRSQ